MSQMPPPDEDQSIDSLDAYAPERPKNAARRRRVSRHEENDDAQQERPKVRRSSLGLEPDLDAEQNSSQPIARRARGVEPAARTGRRYAPKQRSPEDAIRRLRSIRQDEDDEQAATPPRTRRPRNQRAVEAEEDTPVSDPITSRHLRIARQLQEENEQNDEDAPPTAARRRARLKSSRDLEQPAPTQDNTTHSFHKPRRARPAYDQDLDTPTRRARPAYDRDLEIPTRRPRPAYDRDLETPTRRARPAYDRDLETPTRRPRPAYDRDLDTPTTRSRARIPVVNPTDDDEPANSADSYSAYTVPDSLTKVSTRKRAAPSAPRAGHHARSYSHSTPYTFATQFQRIRRHPRFMLIASILLFLLIIVPIIASTHQQSSIRLSTTVPSISHANASTTGGTVSTDPHELVITPPNNHHPSPPVFAKSAYLLDADTGATLYASNPFTHLPMLSTTKLMTALLAAEHGNPDQSITVNDAMQNDINQLSADSALMGVKKGETYTLRDLLYGLLLVSGNDAATVIADALGGTESNFVAQMNQRATQLGLHDTHYVNPHGLLATGQYSSAHDLAILGKYSLGMTLVHQISGTKEYHITQTSHHAEHFLSNGNQLLFWYPGVDAGKTGWDAGTNFIQVISVVRNNHHLIAAVMHTNDWWTDVRDLMNWGFSSFTWVSPHDLDTPSNPIPFDSDWNFFAKDHKENTIATGNQGRYYIFTGYSISGPIMNYFDQNNGLNTFGFPNAEPVTTKTTISQHFEHAAIQCTIQTSRCTRQ